MRQLGVCAGSSADPKLTHGAEMQTCHPGRALMGVADWLFASAGTLCVSGRARKPNRYNRCTEKMVHPELLSRLCHARDLLRDWEDEPVSVNAVARGSDLTRFHFIRLFKAYK